jgi:hypothetical protein
MLIKKENWRQMFQKLHTPSYTHHDQMDEWITHTHNSENYDFALHEGFFMKKMVQICQISKKKSETQIARF